MITAPTPTHGHGGLRGAPALSQAIIDDDSDWKHAAACRNVEDREIFFPSRGDSTRPAKRICGGCVVREECLEYALRHNERFGVWGMASERERRRLRRARRVA